MENMDSMSLHTCDRQQCTQHAAETNDRLHLISSIFFPRLQIYRPKLFATMPARKNFQVKLPYLHVCLRYVQKTGLNLINLKAPTPVSQVFFFSLVSTLTSLGQVVRSLVISAIA